MLGRSRGRKPGRPSCLRDRAAGLPARLAPPMNFSSLGWWSCLSARCGGAQDTFYVRHPEARYPQGEGQERRGSQGTPLRQERSDVSYVDGPDITLLRPRSQERTFQNGRLRARDRASRHAGARSRPSRAARTDIRPRRRYSARRC